MPHVDDPDGGTEATRAAAVELAAAVRALVTAVTVTEAGAADRRRAGARVRTITEELDQQPRRAMNEVASIDDRPAGIAMFSAGSGRASVIAPAITFEHRAGGAFGRVTLARQFEGPPGYTHGGVVAMLMDEILGRASVAAGRWGMTVQLDVSYLRPVPLGRELELVATVDELTERKSTCTGQMTLAGDPEPLTRARAVFVAPRGHVHQQYFGHVRNAAGGPADVVYERGEP